MLLRSAAFVTCCLVAASCGGAHHPEPPALDSSRAPERASSGQGHTDAAPPKVCTPPLAVLPPPTLRTGLDAATHALDDATASASAVRRPFVTELAITLDTGITIRARLTGARAASGASTGRLRVSGAARLLLPDLDLRTERNQLSFRRPGGAWQPLGSASGIALDVGRELLTHPFLLDVTSTAIRGNVRTVRADARAADLRAYAINERHGIATDLVAGAQSLRIDVRIVHGTLTADVFRLRTRLPAQFARQLRSTHVTVVGRTISCAAAPAQSESRTG